MGDLSGGSHIQTERARALVRLAGTRRDTLAMTGEVALVMAAAASMAALLGVSAAPSGTFVLQCFALGMAALGALRVHALRYHVPALSVVAAVALAAIVVLGAAGSGGVTIPLEIAGGIAILPILLLQIDRWRTRAIVAWSGAAGVVLVAALTGRHGIALLQLGSALAFAIGVALVAVAGMDARRARRTHHEARYRKTAVRQRQRNAAHDEMVASLSHDLRNPLAIALGFSEMAEDVELSSEERAQALSGLRRSLWEMSQLVENLLDGSADRAGALAPSLEPLELTALCRDALAATGVLLRERPIALGGSIEPGIVVLADRQRLARVLGNLLGNACKYTAAGEIRLEVAASAGEAVIRVHDTGLGIAPDALPYIFERYRRAHDGGAGGVGLGLAIAHRLVECMSGRLEVASALGVGSTFTVTLPLAPAARGESVAA